MNHILEPSEISSIEASMSNEQLLFLDKKIKNTVYDGMLRKLIESGQL